MLPYLGTSKMLKQSPILKSVLLARLILALSSSASRLHYSFNEATRSSSASGLNVTFLDGEALAGL